MTSVRRGRASPGSGPHPDWIGLGLAGLVATLWIFALLFYSFACGADCGDQGGRGLFLLLTLASPIGLYGAWRFVASLRRTEDAPAVSRTRVIAQVLDLVFGAGVLLAALLALLLLAVAVEGFVSPDRVNSAADYATPAAYALFGAVWAAIGWIGFATRRRLRR